MKNWNLYFFVSIMILLASCQEEEREFIDPNVDNTVPRNSQLASLMKNVVTHDGSFDDIVDRGNCFSINLPYTILLNGDEFVINDVVDYQGFLNTDVIEISFPVTITQSDHVEKIVENNAELEVFRGLCKTEDDDIECIDFVYPMSISTFDSNSNQLNTIEIGHDSQMFNFMSNVRDNISVSINYPINLVLHNGENVGAQHNSELLSKILDAAPECDENDG
ncbi:hypothetical protein [Aquimarina sp. 2304DJ70-9]|uniref:hypothetical protein n=1 Tax=Aquimarina penaris TaxID=3231044 RepID=UPI003462A096